MCDEFTGIMKLFIICPSQLSQSHQGKEANAELCAKKEIVMCRMRGVCHTYGIEVCNSEGPLADHRSPLQLFATLERAVDKTGFSDFVNVGKIQFKLVANL
jgi:hypothetical protein